MKQDYEILKSVATEVAVKTGCKITLSGATDDELVYKFSAEFGRHRADVIIVFDTSVSEFQDNEKAELVEKLTVMFKRFASAHKYACEKRAAQWN